MSDSISANGETRSGLSLGTVWQYVLIYLSLLMPGSTFVYIKGGTWFSFMPGSIGSPMGSALAWPLC